MVDFTLHPILAHDTLEVARLKLCEVRLMNNRLFPWLVLVPQREMAVEITDLSLHDRQQLLEEICHVSKALQTFTGADKMNIAALGNQVPQLHVHVIARFKGDTAWPNPVWGRESRRYDTADAEIFVQRLRTELRRVMRFFHQPTK